MIQRHSIRALVVYNDLDFFFDKGRPQGLTYQLLKRFQKYVNIHHPSGHIRTNVVFLPTSPNRIIKDLIEGRGDIAASNLTITSKKHRGVDFSTPFLTDVKQIPVCGPGEPKLQNLDSLAGKEAYVRKSSSYYRSLTSLNASFEKQGKPKMTVVELNGDLQDSDVLDMVNAGLFPMTIVDDYKADLWAKVLKNITVYPDITVKSGGKIGWAVRKDSPHLLAEINAFMATHKEGTKVGNILIERYLKSADYIKDPLSGNAAARFHKTFGLFKKYARLYHLDWIYVAGLAFQESRLHQSRRGAGGAVGIMQVKPGMASLSAIHIAYISRLQDNIHAGVKYLRFVIDKYFSDPRINRLNKMLFACAAYNAGPTVIAALRKKAAALGFDPNVWFGNVEVVAARDLGLTTVQYVRNIFKYAVAYSLFIKQKEKREHSKRSVEGS